MIISIGLLTTLIVTSFDLANDGVKEDADDDDLDDEDDDRVISFLFPVDSFLLAEEDDDDEMFTLEDDGVDCLRRTFLSLDDLSDCILTKK